MPWPSVQGRYYQAGADATRTEQALQHARELRQRQRGDLERVTREHGESRILVGRDQQQLSELSNFLARAEPELTAARETESRSQAALAAAEAAMADWQQRWETFSRDAAAATHQAEVERARIAQIEAGLARLVAQRSRLREEQGQIQQSVSGARPDEFASAEAQARERGTVAQQQLEQTLETLQTVRDDERKASIALDAAKAALQAAQGELMTVEAVQKAALGHAQAGAAGWLQRQKLDRRPRLAQSLEVAKGWERAVETALGGYLEAICVDGLDALAGAADDLDGGQVTMAESVPCRCASRAGRFAARARYRASGRRRAAGRNRRGRVGCRCDCRAPRVKGGTVGHHPRRRLVRSRAGCASRAARPAMRASLPANRISGTCKPRYPGTKLQSRRSIARWSMRERASSNSIGGATSCTRR